jgi:hypothetical protein
MYVCWLLAGDSVTHTVVIHNTGNAKLRAVTVTTTVSPAAPNGITGLTAYSCKLDAATTGVEMTPAGLDIPKGSTLVCAATYAFSSISLIEAGDLTFATTADAADFTGSVVLDSMVLAVPRVPHFSLTVNEQACSSSHPSPNSAGETGCMLRTVQPG